MNKHVYDRLFGLAQIWDGVMWLVPGLSRFGCTTWKLVVWKSQLDRRRYLRSQGRVT
jgi:hypothetical protein